MTDVIIVGHGLAAGVLMHSFYDHNISFKAIGHPQLSSCSRVAAGIWNPVVFKRLTKSWLAEDLVAELNTFYTGCERRLQRKLITQRPIIKPFTEDQEKKLWLKKAAGELNDFLDPTLYAETPRDLKGCHITNGYGRVQQSGNLDVAAFIDATLSCFKEQVIVETFDHTQLEILTDKVRYKKEEARHIVFCEGHLVSRNPFFHWIPLKPAKGEIMTVQTEQLYFKDTIFNRNGFLMDLADSTFRLGATYAWEELSETPTESGSQELREKMAQIASVEYSILKHEAGIRPSSSDRRPIIGAHPQHSRLFVFNGLGTKGVMLAPYFAKKFVYFYLQKQSLHNDINLSRFYNLYAGQKT